jgi:hypothetical protein
MSVSATAARLIAGCTVTSPPTSSGNRTSPKGLRDFSDTLKKMRPIVHRVYLFMITGLPINSTSIRTPRVAVDYLRLNFRLFGV